MAINRTVAWFGAGATLFTAAGAAVILLVTRPTWESEHSVAIMQRIREALQLQKTDQVQAYQILKESLSETDGHQVTDPYFQSQIQEATRARDALFPKVHAELERRDSEDRAKQEEAKRQAEELAEKKAAAERRRREAEERERERQDQDRKQIEDEQRFASIRTKVTGGAWLTKKAGNSEPIRGLDLLVLKSPGSNEQLLTLLQAELAGSRDLLHKEEESAAFWEKAVQENPDNQYMADHVSTSKAAVSSRRWQVDKLEGLAAEASNSAKSAPVEMREMYNVVFSEAAVGGLSAWDTICRQQLAATGHTDVDGKYSIELQGGHYYLFAKFESAYSEVDWLIPLSVTEAKDIQLDLRNDNAGRITNKSTRE
jgi:hypothetical protein